MPIIRKDVLAAALCFVEPKHERSRYQGVWVSEDGYLAATTGTAMFMAKVEGATESFMIPYAVAKAAIAEAEGLMEVTPTRCGDTDYEQPEESCPDFTRAVPSECSGVTAHFDVALLVRVQKAAKALDRKNGFFDLWHNGDGPAGVMFHQRPDCRAVVMPYRGGGTPWSKL